MERWLKVGHNLLFGLLFVLLSGCDEYFQFGKESLLPVKYTGKTHVEISASSLTCTGCDGEKLLIDRYDHTSTVLNDGRILVVGGLNPQLGGWHSSAEIVDLSANAGRGASQFTAPVSEAKGRHSAFLLSDGRVVILGGRDSSTYFATVEFFNPSANSGAGGWTLGIANPHPLKNASYTKLADDKILVVGGQDSSNNPITDVHIFDPHANDGMGNWTVASSLNSPRFSAEIVSLPNGKVLYAGGKDENLAVTATTEIYDPEVNEWTIGPSMQLPRIDFRFSVLSDNRIIVTGGLSDGTMMGLIKKVEIFTFGSGWSFAPHDNLVARFGHTVVSLPGARVMIRNARDSEIYSLDNGVIKTITSPYARAFGSMNLIANDKVIFLGGLETFSTAPFEVFDVTKLDWKRNGRPSDIFNGAQSVTLKDGSIFFFGGVSASGATASEILKSNSVEWIKTSPMNVVRNMPQFALLKSGKVLVYGGVNSSFQFINSFEIFNPITLSWSTPIVLPFSQQAPTMMTLNDGRVLLCGGEEQDEYGNSVPLAACHTYNEETGVWTQLPNMPNARYFHSMVQLKDGRVLAIGGLSSVILDAVDVFEPLSGAWSSLAPLKVPRVFPISTVLKDGRVLINAGMGLNSVEVYDPMADDGAGSSSLLSDTLEDILYVYQENLLLKDGRVLLIGGVDMGTFQSINKVYIFDPFANTLTKRDDLTLPKGVRPYGITVMNDKEEIFIIGSFGENSDTVIKMKVGNGSTYLSVQGSTGPVSYEVLSGSAIVEKNKIIAGVPGPVSVRATDSLGALIDFTVQFTQLD